MLYQFLHSIFRLSQKIYFGEICIKGNNEIPLNEANIIISNHPSAFMDPIIIGINLKTSIYFLAAEEFMGGKKMSKFLASNFNMIPIYRPSTRPEETYKNIDSFSKCYDALNDKKSILIFAEGHSETQYWLDPLKTGAARIAIETLKNNKKLKKINIISLGLNYSNPHIFRSSLYFNVDKILELKQKHSYNKNTLTNQLQLNLSEALCVIKKEHSSWQEFLLKIFDIEYNTILDLKEKYLKKKLFIKNINELEGIDKKSFDLLRIKIINLKKELEKNNLSVDELLCLKKINEKYYYIFILLLAPSFLLNSFPLFITKWYTNKRNFKYSFEGSIYFTFGTIFTFVWHLLVVGFASFFIGWFALVVPLLLMIIGYYSLKIYDKLKPIIIYKRLNKNLIITNKIEAIYKSIIEENIFNFS